jgi:hypothetical protein
MWGIIKTSDNSFPVIKLDNGRGVMVKIYYGNSCQSNGMSKAEYDAYLQVFAMAKELLEASLHDDFDTSYAKGRCDCPWCHKAYELLDKINKPQ